MAGREGIEPIRLGTGGWRGIIARDLTFDDVGRNSVGFDLDDLPTTSTSSAIKRERR